MTRTTTALAMLCLLAVSLARAAEPVRVALVHGSFGNYRHRDDYDAVTKALGWKLDKFENKDFGKLVGQLDNYDIVLGTALFNYSLNVQDFSVYREQLLAFMRRGGAIVLTDANYPDHLNWLAKWGPDWAVSVAPCKSTTTPNKWLDARHPIFSGDTPVRELSASWSHLEPTTEKGAGWQTLSTCADGDATSLFRTEGRGFMMLSGFWAYDAAQLRNLWATLQYARGGIMPTLPDLTNLKPYDNIVQCGFLNTADQPLTLQMKVGVTDLLGARPALSADGTAAPGTRGSLGLRLFLPRRGVYDLSLALQVKGGPALPTVKAHLVIPPLIETTIIEPRYRGTTMAAAPPAHVRAEVTLHPYGENLNGASYVARLWRGNKLLTSTPVHLLNLAVEVSDIPPPPQRDQFNVTVPFISRGTGDYALEIVLLPHEKGAPSFSARTTIPVVAARPHQVFIDEDLNTRVDGKLFFPITLYHVPAKDFAQVKALGFNSVQAWGSTPAQAKENLDAAEQNGLKVILEGVTYAAATGDLAALDPALKAFENHPALLSWYLTDEPSGAEKLAWCRKVYDYLRARDANHPVFMTSCSPGEFARYAPVTDIFAVDPYPIPAQPVTMVSDWMRTAQEAAHGRKPVWLIPQLHNWAAYDGHPEKGRYPTPEEERNMVYQGLVWGAKAIFYYPWDDGCTGLTKDEKLMAAVGKLNAELAQIGPELLTRRYALTARNDGEQKGLYASLYRGEKGSYIIAVSTDTTAREFTVPAPGLKDGPAEVLFENRQVAVTEAGLKDQFAPLAVHVYRVP